MCKARAFGGSAADDRNVAAFSVEVYGDNVAETEIRESLWRRLWGEWE